MLAKDLEFFTGTEEKFVQILHVAPLTTEPLKCIKKVQAFNRLTNGLSMGITLKFIYWIC